MKLSEMRELLRSRGIQLTKSLGQNFLHDANQLARIAALAELKGGDRVLEIGPGLGPLTEVLLASGAEVLAVEKDHRLCAVLQERLGKNPKFKLVQGDALEWLRTEPRDWSGWKLVSNLPYSVGSPILVELALADSPPDQLIATLQLEVVQRIVARAGDDAYGQLSLFIQSRYEPGEWFKIPASCFFPPPDIDSACLSLRLRQKELIPAHQIPSFVRIVKRAFGERRKVMFKLLKQDWPAPALEAAYSELSLDSRARAEILSLEQFAALTSFLVAPRKP